MQKNVTEGTDRLRWIDAHKKEPSYLTGTVANPLAKTSSPTYADNADTKF
jgi:hypothetical protein